MVNLGLLFVFEKDSIISTGAIQVGFLSLLTIVNEGSSLRKGSSLTIVNEAMSFIKNDRFSKQSWVPELVQYINVYCCKSSTFVQSCKPNLS